MGAVQDKVSSNSTYTRSMNDVELEKQRQLAEIEAKKNKEKNEQERERLEIEKQKANAAFELKKAELLIKFQTDLRGVEAEVIKTRMQTQSDLFSKFIDFMKETLKTNEAMLMQQTKLYELANSNETHFLLFFERAREVNVLSTQKLIDIGAEKVKELNLKSSKEMKYLESRLESVLGITNANVGMALTYN